MGIVVQHVQYFLFTFNNLNAYGHLLLVVLNIKNNHQLHFQVDKSVHLIICMQHLLHSILPINHVHLNLLQPLPVFILPCARFIHGLAMNNHHDHLNFILNHLIFDNCTPTHQVILILHSIKKHTNILVLAEGMNKDLVIVVFLMAVVIWIVFYPSMSGPILVVSIHANQATNNHLTVFFQSVNHVQSAFSHLMTASHVRHVQISMHQMHMDNMFQVVLLHQGVLFVVTMDIRDYNVL
mmetsp:Transcript_1601/g.2242  ORF Transcript_1601/g.2242 Transcript_1601/m.2242 type:complete len:238 (-) Transcript_1601:284-997(-)